MLVPRRIATSGGVDPFLVRPSGRQVVSGTALGSTIVEVYRIA